MKKIKTFEKWISPVTGSSPILDVSNVEWLDELNNIELKFEKEHNMNKWTDELRELVKKYQEMKNTPEYFEHIRKWHKELMNHGENAFIRRQESLYNQKRKRKISY